MGHYLYNDKDYIRGPGEKLLVMHLTIQNPQKRELYVSGNNIRFTGVDSKEKEVAADGYWYDEKSHKEVDMNLKPAQKIEVFTEIPMSAEASLPKLIVNDTGNKVWRYDLHGKVKPLPAPFVDPASTDGSVARDVVPAITGTAYPAAFDLTLSKVEYISTSLFGKEVPDGGRLLVAYLTLHNPLPVEQGAYGSTVEGSFTDQDGLSSQEHTNLFLASREKELEGNIAGGKDIQVRMVFAVEKDTQPQKLHLNVAGGRSYEFDVSGVK